MHPCLFSFSYAGGGERQRKLSMHAGRCIWKRQVGRAQVFGKAGVSSMLDLNDVEETTSRAPKVKLEKVHVNFCLA